MKYQRLPLLLAGMIFSVVSFSPVLGQAPVITAVTYDSITQSSVTLHWKTTVPADSRIFRMVSDSNDQPVVYTDSASLPSLVALHSMRVGNLQSAVMYRYMMKSVNAQGSDSATGYFITSSASTGKVTVWFNHSVDTLVSTGTPAKGNSDFQKLFMDQINKASHSIDITTWLFEDEDSVAACLIRAKERGVKIRFVYDYTPFTANIDTLLKHGIQVVRRNFDTTFTMHDKFWIFDHRYNSDPTNQYLWTGSTNVTHTQFHSDRNNIIIIQDQSLCEVYTREFEEMWGSGTDRPDISRSRFGTEKKGELAHILNIGGIPMEVYFAPTDSIADTLVSLFTTKPVKSIYFSMLKFVFPSIETALHENFIRGISISGVFDSSCSVRKGSAFPRMKGEQVAEAWDPPADVFIDTLPGLLHHKYCLINADTAAGEKILTTGSFNWELPAQQGNDENMLVIHNAAINNLYFQEFMARYRESGGTHIGGSWGIGPAEIGSVVDEPKASPNPFSDRTSISFRVKNRATVSLEIYDQCGRLVAALDEGTMEPGVHLININGSILPSGILLCKINTGSKMHLLKLVHSGGSVKP